MRQGEGEGKKRRSARFTCRLDCLSKSSVYETGRVRRQKEKKCTVYLQAGLSEQEFGLYDRGRQQTNQSGLLYHCRVRAGALQTSFHLPAGTSGEKRHRKQAFTCLQEHQEKRGTVNKLSPACRNIRRKGAPLTSFRLQAGAVKSIS